MKLDVYQNIGNTKPAEVSEIVNQHMFGVSVTWANEYKKNGKNFITCFQKYPSIRTTAAFIVKAYEYEGALAECRETGKDFTEYSERVCPGRYSKVLADLLLIIYCLTTPVNGE